MQRFISLALTGLFLALGVGTASPATEPRGTVIIGQVSCFRIRVPDRGQSVQQRLDFIQDLAAKYLGGDSVRLTVRTVGKRQHIDLNGEFLVAVTPEDARATGHKSAATLAPLWRDSLERAFAQSQARPVAHDAPPAK